MGTLIAMAYPTALFANQADHTYVKCGTGKKAWSCWGGTSGGAEIRRGTGSTQRADRIAQPDGKAGIKCYLINGVCHQAANRILLPASITVRGARGYSISEALFGAYGRVGHWPCKSPFDQYKSVTDDLPECVEAPSKLRMAAPAVLTAADRLDWHYIKGVLEIYREAEPMMRAKTIVPVDAEVFHVKLFMHMAQFHLGPMLDKALSNRLKQVRSKIEKVRVKAETAFAGEKKEKMAAREFVDAFDKATIQFQDEMANAMTLEQYRTLFDLNRDDRVILADRSIVKRVFGIDYKASIIK